jgi:hypothetical protein
MLKLEAYGLSENSLKLLKSYLENRRQRIKIGNNYSEWADLLSLSFWKTSLLSLCYHFLEF